MKDHVAPFLDRVSIFKDGNKSGSFVFHHPKGGTIRFDFVGSLPFSKMTVEDWRPFSGLGPQPASDRMAFLRNCLESLHNHAGLELIPTRFRLANEEEWKIDRKVVRWLIGGQIYLPVAKDGVPDFFITRA